MSGAIFDPKEKTLTIWAEQAADISVHEDGGVVITIKNLSDGIEIIHEDDRIWRPV